jgi:hypothetical protein
LLYGVLSEDWGRVVEDPPTRCSWGADPGGGSCRRELEEEECLSPAARWNRGSERRSTVRLLLDDDDDDDDDDMRLGTSLVEEGSIKVSSIASLKKSKGSIGLLLLLFLLLVLDFPLLLVLVWPVRAAVDLLLGTEVVAGLNPITWLCCCCCWLGRRALVPAVPLLMRLDVEVEERSEEEGWLR